MAPLVPSYSSGFHCDGILTDARGKQDNVPDEINQRGLEQPATPVDLARVDACGRLFYFQGRTMKQVFTDADNIVGPTGHMVGFLRQARLSARGCALTVCGVVEGFASDCHLHTGWNHEELGSTSQILCEKKFRTMSHRAEHLGSCRVSLPSSDKGTTETDIKTTFRDRNDKHWGRGTKNPYGVLQRGRRLSPHEQQPQDTHSPEVTTITDQATADRRHRLHADGTKIVGLKGL